MYKNLLRRKIKHLLKYSERKKVYHNLEEIKSVLVLFDTENYDDAINFIQQMRKLDKTVRAFAYKPKNDVNDFPNTSFKVVTNKDMRSFKHESLNRIVQNISGEKFDLTVDLTLHENLLLLYILVSINSPLKIGLYKHAFSVHDIVISYAPELELTVKELGEQVIHYLTVLK